MEDMLALNIKLNHFYESTMQINEILRDLSVLSYCMSNISLSFSCRIFLGTDNEILFVDANNTELLRQVILAC